MQIMGIIKRSHSTNFYDWPIGKERKHTAVLKWTSISEQPIVVYHPLLPFDPISIYGNQSDMFDRDNFLSSWEEIDRAQLEERYIPIKRNLTPIVHEKIKANFNFFDNLELLLKTIEKNFKVPEDEMLWYDTGYWTGRNAKYTYMGLSEESAFDIWTKSSDLSLCYVASNSSTLLEFKLDKREENIFYLNIYYTNRFVVFPDLIDAVHKSLDFAGNWELLNSEKGNHDTIFESLYKRRGQIFDMPDTTFSIIPAMVIPFSEPPIPGTDFLFAVALENNFYKIETTMNEPEGFAIVDKPGGWMRDDFQSEKRYHLIFSKYRKLENCYVAYLIINKMKQAETYF